MKTFREILQKAEADRVAIGHFNVSDFTLVKAVFSAAQEVKVPVIIGASEGERKFFGTRQLAAVVKSLREEFDWPIYLNADHTHSLESALEAAKAGFDSVVFDLSALPVEENIRRTRKAIEELKSINPAILIEGEIGDIGTGSEIHKQINTHDPILTTPAEARQFVEATGIDVLAPAVGNAHGMVQSMVEGETKKHLRIDRIREIKAATEVFLTLHGGSGTADADLKQSIDAGINIVHINTELRIAWRRGLEEGLAKEKSEVVPYKILPVAVSSVQEVVRSRLKLFNKMP
ncbi:class II fructose-bisphosphate aldolase [Rhizobium sp. P32RR-XVIII]|uniref:class II fructose-bisphosphate aldolase n=1 Tax=Rhizobium sp. P32RR-XVIII TaxID=2726738 RepID=UPI001456FFEE|nr:class II fructose-bisphosphate aldolase [Rhizobium sp. P32RR-XVIII]NLS08363.1 class II fructose-bisphosphate aldolase [Rhizobium sp. P32RR-XVIII]